MPLLEKQLFIKRSLIPGAGKGLFTKNDIKKGTLIVEYKGKITTWKEIKESKNFNPYVYYINSKHVIDAKSSKQHLGRYANDAKGLIRVDEITNNCAYTIQGNRVFIKAIKNIKAGEEILVSYGKEYWEVIKYNNQISKKPVKKLQP